MAVRITDEEWGKNLFYPKPGKNSWVIFVKWCKTAQGLKKKFDDLLFRVKVNDSGEARVATAMVLTISEEFAAFLCLVEGNFSSHEPIMVRSMLEGLANLINLVNDATNLNQIRFENARSDVTLFEEYEAFPEMQNEKEAIARLKTWADLAHPIRYSLKGSVAQKQRIDEKFKLAGIQQNYVSYRILCSFAHNQLTTLIARHAGSFEMRYYAAAPEATTVSMINIATSILCQAISRLSKLTTLPEADVDMVLQSANQDWAKFLPEDK